jgi:integrase/recombinase XerD
MSALRDVAADYLRMRRALGYKLEIQGLLLAGFVAYLEDINANTVTIENAVAWATLPAGADPSYWAGRLSVARQFARHLQTLDPHNSCHTGHGERSPTSTRRRRSPR